VNTFDQQGRLVKTVHEWDWSFDGILDEVGTTTLAYDARGDLLNTIYELDRSGDGSMDEVGRTANRHDGQGNLVNTTYELDQNADGTVEHRRTPNTYHQRRQLLKQVVEEDLGADGVADLRSNHYEHVRRTLESGAAADHNGFERRRHARSVVTITTTYLIRGLEKSRQVMM
jgi:hypothetical protein